MPVIAMLVLRLTLPTSTGCLSFADVNSRTKLFLPGFHWPDSLVSVITTSLVFWVWITFSAPWAVPVSSIAEITMAIIRFMSHTSLLVDHELLGGPDRGPRLAATFVRRPMPLRCADLPLAQPVEENGRHDQ